MIAPEQAVQIKKQLLEQINSTFPEDKKAEAIQQIEAMNEEQLEEFLKQNNMMQAEGKKQKCVFCSIVFGDIPSTKIDENEKAIAVLEINPISKAHVIIIPKDHVKNAEEMPAEAKELAEQIKEKIKKEFQPKDVIIVNQNLFGHEILNVLPVYTNETMNSPKKQATPEDLKKISDVFAKKEEVVEEKPQEEINEKNTWLPNRIP